MDISLADLKVAADVVSSGLLDDDLTPDEVAEAYGIMRDELEVRSLAIARQAIQERRKARMEGKTISLDS